MISPGHRYRPRKSGPALSIALIASLGVPFAQASSAPGSTERISVASDGSQRNRVPTGSTTSCGPSTVGKCAKRTISGDGSRVVFVSRAPNLVDGDTNGKADVFLSDAAATPKVKRISVGAGGVQADADSETPTISPDGKFIAFETLATNLVDGDNKLVSDVFIYDVEAGTLSLASVTNSGGQSNQASFSPSVANDGSVSFTSFATNLTSSAPSQYQNVFVRRAAHTGTASTIYVSLGGTVASPLPGDGPSKESTISGDGTKVAFTSAAKNVGGSEAEPSDDIFIATVGASSVSSIQRITNASGDGGRQSFMPSISTDGSKVAFVSDGLDADPRKDIYIANTSGGNPSIASKCECDETMDRPAVVPAMSNSGTVAFQSPARFVPVNSSQVWVSTGSGTPANASSNSAGTTAANQDAEFPSISDDGNYVVFTSAADNLVPSDGNGASDVFLKKMDDNTITRVSVSANGTEASGFLSIPVNGPAVSDDGKIVAFDSDSSNLDPADGNGLTDVFYRNRATGETKRISLDPTGGDPDGASSNPSMSADGRFVAFESSASTIVPDDTNGVSDVFVWDRDTGTIKMVSKVGSQGGFAASTNPAISANGGWIVFESKSSFSPYADPAAKNVYRYDMSSGDMDIVSKQKGANSQPFKSVSQDSWGPSVADNGRVAFLTEAKKLPDPPDPDTRNYVDALVTKGTALDAEFIRVTVAPDNSTVANGHTTDVVISRDGEKVAFTSLAGNLTSSADNNPDTDVFLRDIATASTALVSKGLGRSSSPVISADGNLVAFVSSAGDIVPGDSNAVEDIFLGGVNTQTVRVNVANDGSQATGGGSFFPAMSGNGQAIVYASMAANLVPGDDNESFDHFVRDLSGFVPQPCGAGGCTVPPPGGGGGGGFPAGTAYRFVAADGGIFNFGEAKMFGSLGDMKLNKPIVGMAATPSNQGYWLTASDGGVFSFGDAKFLGSTGAIKLNSPIVAMAATPSGNGYWFVAADGGIFSHGDAKFHGSMGGKPLNRPIVAMAPTASGNGYWLVASDGGIFSFGDAKFHGSTGGINLNKPIVGMDRSISGNGYRFVAADGGIFSFGDAKFLGSVGAESLNKPIVGMAKARSGDGYWLVASDGGIFSFGDSKFAGSTGDINLNSPIVGMAG